MKKYAKVKKLNWSVVFYRGCRQDDGKRYIGQIGKIDKNCSGDKSVNIDFSDGHCFNFRSEDLIMADTKKELQGAKT